MNERPILFTSENVQLILKDWKTQTRRIVQFPKKWDGQGLTHNDLEASGFWNAERTHWQYGDDRLPQNWQIGDRLWIKEAHYLFGDIEHYKEHGKSRWRFHRKDDRCFYLDGPPVPGPISGNIYWQWKDRWFKRSPLFMERRDARWLIELTAVRVEQLNRISEEDCFAEGIPQPKDVPGHPGSSALLMGTLLQAAYKTLWDSINGRGSWDKNPFVWALTFKRVTA